MIYKRCNSGIFNFTHYKLSNLMDKFDYIIVGAGSAGCVLANRLSGDLNNHMSKVYSRDIYNKE